MIRRMSNRLALRAARRSASSSSGEGAPPRGALNGSFGSSTAMGVPSDQQDVQDDENAERDPAEQPGRAPPHPVARVGMLLALLGAGEAPDEPAQRLGVLRLGDERHQDEDHPADDEGDDRLPEA